MKHAKNTLLYAAAELFRKNRKFKVTVNPEDTLRKSRGNVLAFGLTCVILLLGVQAFVTPSFIDGRTNWLFVGLSALISATILLFLWFNRATPEQKTVAVTWKPVRERLIEHLIEEAENAEGPSPTGALRLAIHRKFQDPYGDPATQEHIEKLAQELGMKLVDITHESV